MVSKELDCVIKLGGAAITEKSTSECLKPDNVVSALIRQLARLHHKKVRYVLVHGAGSFGHGHAKRYGLATGGTAEMDSELLELAKGIWETHSAVCSLHSIIINKMIDEGIPAVGFSPLGSWWAAGSSENLSAHNIELVQAALETGFVPVLHGDVILDQHQKVRILSGDAIVSKLAESMQPRTVAYVTDVPGVLSEWPHGQLVRSIAVDKNRSIVRVTNSVDSTSLSTPIETDGAEVDDVTGGMASKLTEACRVASLGIPVRIIQPDQLDSTVSHDTLPRDWIGTEIVGA